MRICFIGYRRLQPALERDGHETLCLTNPEPGAAFHLAEELDRAGFRPDLVVQRESLGERRLPEGLDELDCPVVFWSLDTHLNFYWHRRAAGLYDMTLTTQPAWVEPLRRAGAPGADVLTWLAPARPWRPWSERAHWALFVGRVTPQRPMRQAMADLLVPTHGLVVRDDVPFLNVPDVYQDACVVPNETIAAEVNLRLFEAAACGCLVLSPAQAADQDRYFRPGREYLPYADGVELLAAMQWCRDNPAEAEAMARRAWVRTRAEHMPEHRAAGLLAAVEAHMGSRPRGEQADRAWLLTLFELWQAGRMGADPDDLLRRLAAWPDDPACTQARLAILCMIGRLAEARDEARRVAAIKPLARDAECALAASAAALNAGEPTLAAFLATHHARLNGVAMPEVPVPEAPQGQAALWASWVGLLRRAELLHRPGFDFDPERHLPACALDCIALARYAEPEEETYTRRMEELLRHVPGATSLRCDLLADISRRRRNWRNVLETALARLDCLQAAQGMAELKTAHALAREAGREIAFLDRVSRTDPSGRLLAGLNALKAAIDAEAPA